MPDLVFAADLDSTEIFIEQSLSETFDEVATVYSESFSVSAGFTYGAFSVAVKFNQAMYTANEMMKSGDYYQAHSVYRLHVFHLTAYPYTMQTLHPMFAMELNDLPETIVTAQDARDYLVFFQGWGTHFAADVIMGGYTQLDTYVNQTLFKTHTDHWVSYQISLDFHFEMFSIDPGFFTNRSQINISSTFLEAAQTYMFFEGGNMAYQTNATLPQWMASVPSQPIATNYTLNPLYWLVANPTQAATLKAATAQYIQTGTVTTSPFYVALSKKKELI